MAAMVSQITSFTIVYSTVYTGVDKRNIKAPRHWPLWPMNFPHKGPVTWKLFPFDDVIMVFWNLYHLSLHEIVWRSIVGSCFSSTVLHTHTPGSWTSYDTFFFINYKYFSVTYVNVWHSLQCKFGLVEFVSVHNWRATSAGHWAFKRTLSEVSKSTREINISDIGEIVDVLSIVNIMLTPHPYTFMEIRPSL